MYPRDNIKLVVTVECMSDLMKFDQYIPYGKHSIHNNDLDVVMDIMQNGWLTQGVKVEEFEEKLGAFLDARYVTVVNNGTSALYLAYAANEVNRKSKLILTNILSRLIIPILLNFIGKIFR